MCRSLGLLLAALLVTGCGERLETVSEDPAMEPENGAQLPYGSWPSIISAESLVEGSRSLGGLRKDGEFFYWMESRPEEGGRNTIMQWREGEEPRELLGAPWNVRTRVQEYGGGSLLIADGVLWFSNFTDQRLYRFTPGEEPVPITPDLPLRYAGCAYDAPRQRLICIREDHRGIGEPANALVTLSPDVGSEGDNEGDILFSGSDFVSAPQLSPDGTRIAFTSWMHPNMPWDSTSLNVASFGADGHLTNAETVNAGIDESVIDPQWSPDNVLHALSDRDNWWRPYRIAGFDFIALDTGLENVEIGGPTWSIGARYYQFLPDGDMLFVARRGSVEHLYRFTGEGPAVPIDVGAVDIGSMVPDGERLFLSAGFADRPAALIETSWKGEIRATIRRTRDSVLDPEWIPEFRQVTFPLPGGGEAHGVYFPPTNPDFSAPEGDTPPLIVTVHGGPTSVAGVSYLPGHYFWTSRGFAVLDLNYRGSTGFGREYRRALYGNWGVADVEDVVAGAAWLAEQGLANAEQLIIRGGSAGGYTTLAVHAFHDTFAAGASYYGVSDIQALAEETHKFESRYLDQLIGPFPERKDLYDARSPLKHLDGFTAPLLLLQGLDDPIVPPNQSEMIYEALKTKGVPTAYVAYEGESHGFRKAENQISSRQAELYFYARVLGFEAADDLPAIVIDNLDPQSDDVSGPG